MSRHVIKLDPPVTVNGTSCVEFAFGRDHACGWYYQYFDKAGDCILDRDTMFHGVTTQQMEDELIKRGVSLLRLQE